MKIVKWSNSALTTLQMCGEKFRRRYIEKEFSPSSVAGVAGAAVHRVARTALLRKMERSELPTIEEAKDLAADEFDRAWRQGVQLTTDEAAEGIAVVEGKAKDFAVDLSGFHVDKVAPVINPVGVERKIIVKPRDSDIQINGVIDLIDGTPAGEVIRDLKTSKKSPNRDAADKSLQLSFYALIRRAEVGKLPAGLLLDYLVRTPERGWKSHVVQHTERSEEDLAALVSRLNVAVAAVERGIFVPAPAEAWWCSRNWCEFFSTCPYVRRGNGRPTT